MASNISNNNNNNNNKSRSTDEQQQQPAPIIYQCIDCQKSLPRGSFSKKVFASSSSEKTCRLCRQAATALRTKQPGAATSNLMGRRADSGQHRRPNNFGYCHYVDQLFAKACFADIAALRVFNSAKDVSESMAVLQGALKHGSMFKDKKASDYNSWGTKSKILCLCIGDGATPRTAVLCAYLQRNWTCVSIDPALRNEWHAGDEAPQGVHGLVGVKGTLEDFLLQPPLPILHQEYSSMLILCVHSHARFLAPYCTVSQIRQLFSPGGTEPLDVYCQSADSMLSPVLQLPSLLLPTTIVSLPCCPKFRHVKDIGVPPQIQYEDDGVFSACRKVEVWNFD